MRKMLVAVPMIASLTLAGAVGPVMTNMDVQAAARIVQDESAKWLKIDSAHKTVTLKVIADATNDNGGFNFNGYGKGTMQVRVPQGWNVKVTFQNMNSSIPHSLMIVPYQQRNQEAGFKTAFSGASVPSPTQGITKGTTDSFHFYANKSGTFAMICAVPGHSERAGMWDTLTVSTKYKSPAVVVTENNSASGNGGY